MFPLKNTCFWKLYAIAGTNSENLHIKNAIKTIWFNSFSKSFFHPHHNKPQKRKWKPQTDDYDDPVKATCHNSSSSPWTPCSAGSCGVGVSTRVIRTTKGCNQMSNLRLCENHKCDDNKYRSYHQLSNISNQKNSVRSNSRKWSNRHRTRVSMKNNNKSYLNHLTMISSLYSAKTYLNICKYFRKFLSEYFLKFYFLIYEKVLNLWE